MAKIEGINEGDVDTSEPPEDPIAGDSDNEGPGDDGESAESDGDGESGPSSEGELDGETDDDTDPDAEQPGKEPAAAPEALPEGFSSQGELIEAAKASRQREAELVRLREAFYGLRPQAPPPEKPKPWVPGADDPEVVRAWETVAESPELAKSLPPDLAHKVSGLDRAIRARWTTYQRDPAALVRDHVIPMLEGSRLVAEVRSLRDELAAIKGAEILKQHQSVVSSPEDRAALGKLLDDGMSGPQALRFLAMQKELAVAKKKPAANQGAQAQRDKDRASQAAKKSGQRPGRPGQAPKTSDAHVLAQWAKRVHENT